MCIMCIGTPDSLLHISKIVLILEGTLEIILLTSANFKVPCAKVEYKKMG